MTRFYQSRNPPMREVLQVIRVICQSGRRTAPRPDPGPLPDRKAIERSMNKRKETAIGFVVGIIANTLGVLLYILLFSDMGIVDTYNAAVEQGHVGSLLALGAILNLAAFFGFLRLRRDYRARGVLMATVLTALVILYYKIS